MSKKFLGTLAVGALIGSALGLFFSPGTGKENRTKFKKVATKVSEELVTEVAKLKVLSKKEYDAVVENIVKKYSKNDLMDPKAWTEIGGELKERWADIQKEMKKPVSVKKTTGKKGAK